jgi:hypothetical protein
MKKELPEGLLSFHRKIPLRGIRNGSGRTDLCAKGLTIAEVTGHGPFGVGVKDRSIIRTGIKTRFATDASLFICHDRIGFR